MGTNKADMITAITDQNDTITPQSNAQKIVKKPATSRPIGASEDKIVETGRTASQTFQSPTKKENSK